MVKRCRPMRMRPARSRPRAASPRLRRLCVTVRLGGSLAEVAHAEREEEAGEANEEGRGGACEVGGGADGHGTEGAEEGDSDVGNDEEEELDEWPER